MRAIKSLSMAVMRLEGFLCAKKDLESKTVGRYGNITACFS